MLAADDFDRLAYAPAAAYGLVAGAPRLTQARCELLKSVVAIDPSGERRTLAMPHERPLTVFVDRQEVVTLMTLGVCPEWLVLGWLLNQRLVGRVQDVESVSVDWDVGAAAVRTHGGVQDLAARTARRVVTTGCGQGTVFGDLMAQTEGVVLPPPHEARIAQGTIARIVDAIRLHPSVHRSAGSVHGCALFEGARMLMFVEDVGRHNAIDTVTGWMALHGVGGGDKIVYTTGRLTSEMVMKAARIGVPIVVSRNGVTAMGHELAVRLGMALFARAVHRHFLCYSGAERFDAEPGAAPPAVRVVSG